MTTKAPKNTTTESTEAPAEAGKETGQSRAKSNKLLQARHAATARLIADHQEEFNRLYSEEAQARGVEYTPPLNEEQKAEAALRAILEKHPELAGKVGGQVPVEGTVTPEATPQV